MTSFSRKYKRKFVSALIVLGGLLLGQPLLAQFSSNVQGIVTDPSGSPVPKAKVQLKNTATGITIPYTTNNSGFYRFTGVQPGSYTVTVNASGFNQTQIAASVTQSQTADVPVKLGVAKENTSVTVTTQSAALDTDETRLVTTLDSKTIRDLPLQNRDIYSVITAAPGVTGFLDTGTVDNFQTGNALNVSANGHYSNSNTYILDGIEVDDVVINGGPDLSPNPDSVQEAALQTNVFTADRGYTSGVVDELTSKSGTNQFHGDANFIFNNQDLRAATEFVHEYSPFKRYDATGALGGPIVKNKTFFFVSTDIKRSTSQATGLAQFEDPAFVNFAQSNYPNTLGTKFLTTYRPTNAAFTNVLTYANPTFTAFSPTPTSAINTPYLDQGINGYTPYNNGYQWNARGDQYFHQGSDRLFVDFYRTHNDNIQDQLRPSLGGSSYIDAWFGSVNYQKTFTPNLVNQASFGLFHIDGGDVNNVTPFIPYLFDTYGSESVSLDSTGGPSNFNQFNYQWRDTLTYVKGRHSIHGGFEGQRQNDIAGFNYSARPAFGITSLANFVRDGTLQEGGISFDPLTGGFKPLNFGVQNTIFGAYVTDEWKARDNLLITYGVRWDDFGNPYAYGYNTYINISNLYLGPGATIDQQIENARLVQQKNVYQRGQGNNWSPRGGFSWAPTQDRKLTLRGGVGLYRDNVTLGQVIDGLRGNPPGWVFPTFGNGNPGTPLLSFGNSTTAPYGYTYPRVPPATLLPNGGLSPTPGVPTPAISGLAPNLVMPKTISWQFAVEKQLGQSMVVSAAYSGSHGYDILSGTDYNRFAGDKTATDSTLNRLNPDFASMTYISNMDRSYYHAAILSVRQRLGSSLNYQASFTWSKAEDYGVCASRQDFNAGVDCPPDQHDYYNYKGVSAFNVPYRGSISGSYTTPGLKNGFLGVKNTAVTEVLGGWEISVLGVLQSGLPWTAVNYNNFDPTCSGRSVTCGDYNGDGYNQDIPNVLPNTHGGGFTYQQYLHGTFGPAASAFSTPAPGTEGNEGRNIFLNPDTINIDASSIKNFKLPFFGEAGNLQLRADFFNVLNRVNLHPVDYNIGSSTFGRALDTYQPRIIQLGARIDF